MLSLIWIWNNKIWCIVASCWIFLYEFYNDARIVLWCTDCTMMYGLYYDVRIVLWCTDCTMMYGLYYDARIHERKTEMRLRFSQKTADLLTDRQTDRQFNFWRRTRLFELLNTSSLSLITYAVCNWHSVTSTKYRTVQ